jgi:hypothetical protein
MKIDGVIPENNLEAYLRALETRVSVLEEANKSLLSQHLCMHAQFEAISKTLLQVTRDLNERVNTISNHTLTGRLR